MRFLPLLIPVRHFYLAARQADDGRGMGRTGNGHGKVLNEGVKTLRQVAVAIDEVQHFIEQQQHWRIRHSEHLGERFSSRWCRFSRVAECGYALFSGNLAGQIDPRIFTPFGGIPSVADEDADAGFGRTR